MFGTVFLFFGLAACAIAAIRKRSEIRILIWLGIWSGTYGARLLAQSPAVVAALPRVLQAGTPYLIDAITYLLLVAALLAWSELTVGAIRRFTQIMAVLGLSTGLAGIGGFLVTGSSNSLLTYNNLLAVCALLVLAAVVAVPKLSRKFLVLPNRILAASTVIFAIEGLYINLTRVLNLPSVFPWVNDLVFASFLFSIAYVAGEKVFANERRLNSIENELAIARRIQASILPTTIPQVDSLRIAAAYQPMAAVGGDFYEFIQMDEHRVGVLVADVTGHGMPAALIASMIKVAVQSVVACAPDPAAVLQRLNRILSSQMRGQLISAAYLWIDTEAGQGLYSAAGHPPLLRWREGNLKRIESNGLLFGVREDCDYPVCHVPLQPGDRFLLYTDGVVEPENTAGDWFGDRKLEEVMHDSQSRSALELTAHLLSEIASWQAVSITAQQDDITLIVMDVV